MRFKDIPYRTKRVPGWITNAIIVISILIPLYWIYSGTAVYRVVVDWQVSIFDAYLPVISWLVTLVCGIAIAPVVVHFIASFLPKTQEEIELLAKRADKSKKTDI